MNYDASIIGAGIIGAACAERLSSEGLSVIVLEAGIPGGGATAAGMGHVVVMDDSAAQFDLTAYGRKLWDKFTEEHGGAVEFSRCGTIWIAADDLEMAEAARKREYYSARGVEAATIDAEQLSALEPGLAPGFSGGIVVPGDSVIYQLTATRCLLQRAAANGAVLRIGARVLEIGDGRIELENGDRVSSERIVVAAGCSSQDLGLPIGVGRRKGHLIVTERRPGFLNHQLVELGYLNSAHSPTGDSVAFNLQPRGNGQVLIGSSRESGTRDRAADLSMIRKMLKRALTYMPGLAGLYTTRIWTGFRPSTPDNLPYIGEIPHYKGVYAATGHEGLGITCALATGRLIADEIAGRESEIDRAPYSPRRYAGN